MTKIRHILRKIRKFINWRLLIGLGFIVTGFQALKSGVFYAGKYGQIYPGEYGQIFLLALKFIGGSCFTIFGIYLGLKKLKKKG